MNKPAFEDTLPIDTSGGSKPAFEDTLPIDGDQGTYWGDVKRNAMQEVKSFPGGMAELGKTIFKAGAIMRPDRLGRSMNMIDRGRPTSETPVGESVQAAGQLAMMVPKTIFGVGKNLISTAKAPFQVAGGMPLSRTDYGQEFRKQPIGTSLNTAAWAIPATRLFKRSMAPKPLMRSKETVEIPEADVPSLNAPNPLETRGGQGLYQNTGIRGVTIQKLARRGENPGTVGTNLIRDLEKEGAIGSTSAKTWDNINRLKNTAGKEVGSALDAIRSKSSQYGGVDDPLVMSTDKALKPLYEEWADHAAGATSQSKVIAREFERVHEFLVNKAKSQGNQLHLDDIRDVMDEVGPLTHVGNDIKQEAMSSLYRSLADTRDAMIQTIADEAKNPSLSSDLLRANKKYSQIVRIMPDVSRASSMEAVGQPNMGGLFSQMKDAILSSRTVNKGIMKVGAVMQKLTKDEAKIYLKRAGGNKNLARQMALEEGKKFK